MKISHIFVSYFCLTPIVQYMLIFFLRLWVLDQNEDVITVFYNMKERFRAHEMHLTLIWVELPGIL